MLNASFFNLMENTLMASDLKQRVYANNIANQNTPEFKQQDVQFTSLLQQAMAAAPPAKLGQKFIPISAGGYPLNIQAASEITPRIVQPPSTVMSNNGNNVDIDAQMVNLAENQIEYNTLVKIVLDKFNNIKNAISG